MFRMFARFWAKRRYVWRQEQEAALNDLNAAVSLQRAQERRDLIVQLNKEAEDIEKNIKAVAEKDEKGYWLCDYGHEFDEQPFGGCSKCEPIDDKVVPVRRISRETMTGQEQYEADQQRKEAEKIAQSKRDYAAQLPEEIKGQEDTAKHFRRQAASSRELADRLRRI